MNGTRIDRSPQRYALLRSYVAPEVVAHIMSDGRTPLRSGVRPSVTSQRCERATAKPLPAVANPHGGTLARL